MQSSSDGAAMQRFAILLVLSGGVLLLLDAVSPGNAGSHNFGIALSITGFLVGVAGFLVEIW